MRTTDAWVITRGTNTGVMKYVGETLQDISAENDENTEVCIGIVPWHMIANRNSLQCSDKRKQSSYAQYNMSTKLKNNNNEVDQQNPNLDNNHTHFLLVDVDDKTNDKEINEFRTKVEKSIRGINYKGKWIPWNF